MRETKKKKSWTRENDGWCRRWLISCVVQRREGIGIAGRVSANTPCHLTLTMTQKPTNWWASFPTLLQLSYFLVLERIHREDYIYPSPVTDLFFLVNQDHHLLQYNEVPRNCSACSPARGPCGQVSHIRDCFLPRGDPVGGGGEGKGCHRGWCKHLYLFSRRRPTFFWLWLTDSEWTRAA